jgi:hypothetical protein
MTADSISDRRFYVYALLRKDGTPFYIGKGQGSRWRHHELAALPNRSHKDTIILMMRADGIAEIPKIKFATRLTNDEAKLLEMDLIRLFGRKPHGPLCNQTIGGEGSVDLSDEARAKIVAFNRTRIFSEQTRQKMSASKKDKKHTEQARKNMGDAHRNPSKETRARMSESHKNLPTEVKARIAATHQNVSAETRAKLSAAGKGRPHSLDHRAKLAAAYSRRDPDTLAAFIAARQNQSAETRAKIAAAHRGKTVSMETRMKIGNARRGKRHSEESRAKMRLAHQKRNRLARHEN